MKEKDTDYLKEDTEKSDDEIKDEEIKNKEGEELEKSVKDANDNAEEKEASPNTTEENDDKTPEVTSTLPKRANKKKKKRFFSLVPKDYTLLNITVYIIFIFLVLIPFAYSTHTIETNIEENTISIQKGINSSIHDIELLNITNNVGNLVSLQSELTEIKMLIEQTDKMNESLFYTSVNNERNYLLDYVNQKLTHIEQGLLGYTPIDENSILGLQRSFEIINTYLDNNPTTSYQDFIKATNTMFEEN